MRGVWAGSLGLSLGMLVGGSAAQEVLWRPAVPANTVAPVSARGPAAVLGRPVPLTAGPGPATDRSVTPVAFSSLSLIGTPPPLARAQNPEIPLPLPPGPPPREPAKLQVEAGLPQGNRDKPAPEAPTLTMPRKVEGNHPPGHATTTPVPGGGQFLVPFLSPHLPCEPSACEPYCRSDIGCGPASCLWLSGEYLLWWTKDAPAPPLVTSSPAGTPRELAGVLGVPGTAVLFGGSSINSEERSGGRFGLGLWLDPCERLALETNYFFLGQRTVPFHASSSGLPILARPFFDVVLGRESSELIAFPGLLAGAASVSAFNRLWGLEENLRANLCHGTAIGGTCYRFGLLGGFRFLRLDEGLTFTEALQVTGGDPTLVGTRIGVTDVFGTHNSFYGGQLGAMLELRRGRWYCDLVSKLALGSTHQVVNINGSTAFTVPGGPTVVQPGGLLALPTNIGHYSRDFFAVVPEVGVKVGYQFGPHVRAFVGYSFLYWSNVARPGNQVDRVVNVAQLPMLVGSNPAVVPPRPAFAFHGTDFWAQGINFGLEFRY